jgi:hypothetical protein
MQLSTALLHRPRAANHLNRASAPPVCDTPLLRADVTRLDSFDDSTPLEDKGPLSGGNNLLAQDSRDARLPLREVQRLGQDVRQLLGGSDANQRHMAILDHLMSKVLPVVDVLRTLSTTNDVISPLNACGVVLIHRSRGRSGEAHVLAEMTKVQNLRRRRRRRVFESGLGYAQGCGNVTDVIGIGTIGVEAMYQDLVLTVTF